MLASSSGTAPPPPEPPSATGFGSLQYGATSAVSVLDFNAQQPPLNPNGTLTAPNPDAPFGIRWLHEFVLRRLVLERDLLFQFAGLVAGQSGSRLEKYVPGSDMPHAFESMITNVAVGAILSDISRRQSLAGEEQVAAAKDIQRQVAELVRRATQAALGGSGGDSAPPMSEATRSELDQLYAAGRAAVLRRPADVAERARGAAAAAAVQVPPVEARQVPISLAPGPASSVPQTYSLLQGEPAPAADAPPAIDLTDRRVLSAWLLFNRGATSVDRQLIGDIVSGEAEHGFDAKQLAQILPVLERILHNHSSPDWYAMPEHLGIIFFSVDLQTAVKRAHQWIRDVCAQHGTLEKHLMTHEDVRTDFAGLVACFLNEPRVQIRFGASNSAGAERRRKLQGYKVKFRLLTHTWRKVCGEQLRVLTFNGIQVDWMLQRREEQRDGEYVRRTGQYYSDLSRFRCDRTYP
jgi:hypothetical protein